MGDIIRSSSDQRHDCDGSSTRQGTTSPLTEQKRTRRSSSSEHKFCPKASSNGQGSICVKSQTFPRVSDRSNTESNSAEVPSGDSRSALEILSTHFNCFSADRRTKIIRNVSLDPQTEAEIVDHQCGDDMAAGYQRMSGDARRYPSSSFSRSENRPPMSNVPCRNGPLCRKFAEGEISTLLVNGMPNLTHTLQALVATITTSAPFRQMDLTCMSPG